MSLQIEKAWVNGYKANVELQFQQKQSRLRGTVMEETQNSEYEYYDRLLKTEASERTTRHGDTPITETPHDRRRNSIKDYEWADLIDKQDKLRMIADPTSAYVQNAVAALNRKMDKVIIAAATGSAFTGKNGETEVTFTGGGGNTIPVNYVESGSPADSNLTIGKLRRARFLLESAEAIEDGEVATCVLSASQMQSLLRTTEVTSADYNTVKALVNGAVDTFMGFKFVRTELLTKASNNRTILFYPKSAMTLGVAENLNVQVAPRVDKSFSVQVYAAGTFGAVRMWEEKVIAALCDETK